MTRDRVGLAVLALFLGLVLVGGATAGSGAQASPLAMLSHAGSEAQYLSSIGVNPTGFVIQRGHRNYAGPKCPGKGWTCTKAHRVLQFATAGGVNSVACTSSRRRRSVGQLGSDRLRPDVHDRPGLDERREQRHLHRAGVDDQRAARSPRPATSSSRPARARTTATVTQTSVQGPSACSPPSGSSRPAERRRHPDGDGGPVELVRRRDSANVSQTATQCAGTTTNGARGAEPGDLADVHDPARPAELRPEPSRLHEHRLAGRDRVAEPAPARLRDDRSLGHAGSARRPDRPHRPVQQLARRLHGQPVRGSVPRQESGGHADPGRADQHHRHPAGRPGEARAAPWSLLQLPGHQHE